MRPIGDLLYEPGQPFRHVVASDCFRDEDPGDVLRLQARLADGSPLPKWMRFDTRHFTFTGVVPAEVSQELTVRVVANDVDGWRPRAALRSDGSRRSVLNVFNARPRVTLSRSARHRVVRATLRAGHR